MTIIKPRQEGPHGNPDFLDILSCNDKESYLKLQKEVGSPIYRYNRNRQMSTLNDLFEKIRQYCQGNDEDQWKRYLVCGICWFEDYLAINTRQLRFLISKSKSSINDALSKMGYSTVPFKGEQASLLMESIPFLFGRHSEARKWSIRKQKFYNKQIENKNVELTDDEFKYKDDLDFLEEYINTLDPYKNEKELETDNEFTFVNFDKIDDAFNLECEGYEKDFCSSKDDTFFFEGNDERNNNYTNTNKNEECTMFL